MNAVCGNSISLHVLEEVWDKKEVGAEGRGRTDTLLRAPDFETGASANSATSARSNYNRSR